MTLAANHDRATWRDWRTWPLYPTIAAGVTLLVLTTIAALTTVSIRREQASYRSELETQARAMLETVAISIQDSLYFLDTDEVVKTSGRLVETGLVEWVKVYGPSGRVLSATDEPLARHKLEADEVGTAVVALDGVSFEWSPDRLMVQGPIVASGELLGGLRMSLSTALLRQKLAALRLQGAVAAALALAVGFLLSLVLTRAVTKPLARVVAATERLAHGGLDQTLAVPVGRSEAAILGSALEEMRVELFELYRDLEDQVETRTRELAASNLELEAKNAELERFAYTVSHDLKSPLITIRSFCDLIRRDLEAGDTARPLAHATRIAGAAETMNRLLTELLELSRIGRVVNPPQEVALGELVEEAVRLVSGELHASGIELAVAPDLPAVWGDRTRLIEVFENLLSNAIAAVAGRPGPRIEIGQRPGENGGPPVFYVRDNGKGIEPRLQDRVFGLFHTLDPASGGSGVGLAIVKRIVEVHQGRIWVESAGSGRGAAFCFTLPVSSVAPSPVGGV